MFKIVCNSSFQYTVVPFSGGKISANISCIGGRYVGNISSLLQSEISCMTNFETKYFQKKDYINCYNYVP